jgi:DNA-binding response OmpR family regulator
MVVEDEALIAMLIETALEDAGCHVVGPYSRLADGLAAAGRETVEAALLDVNLAGEKVFPLAERLEAMGVPFLLLSGYGDKVVAPGHPGWRSHAKPFAVDKLLESLADLLR